MERSEIIAALREEDPETVKSLFRRAYEEKVRHFGQTVHLRGLIEFSNVCVKNCLYCGIRRSNAQVERYTMTKEEVLECARFCQTAGYGSVVLQSGERFDPGFVDFVEDIVRSVKEVSGGELGVTLSCGEQPSEVYARWFTAGAHRYLLRIETSDRDLYGRLHPADHSYDARVQCLRALKEVGYQVGTGVMIGLPEQSAEQLADDILFFRKMDVDMIGMGPFILHSDTPMADSLPDFEKKEQFTLGLKMIALTRLCLKDVNIAAATALQALDPVGREKGVLAGANIIMPNVTPASYRRRYQLYEGKPCLDEEPSACGGCLAVRLQAVGENVAMGQWGDSPHFKTRTGG